jgi:hypothetical protein
MIVQWLPDLRACRADWEFMIESIAIGAQPLKHTLNIKKSLTKKKPFGGPLAVNSRD